MAVPAIVEGWSSQSHGQRIGEEEMKVRRGFWEMFGDRRRGQLALLGALNERLTS